MVEYWNDGMMEKKGTRQSGNKAKAQAPIKYRPALGLLAPLNLNLNLNPLIPGQKGSIPELERS